DYSKCIIYVIIGYGGMKWENIYFLLCFFVSLFFLGVTTYLIIVIQIKIWLKRQKTKIQQKIIRILECKREINRLKKKMQKLKKITRQREKTFTMQRYKQKYKITRKHPTIETTR